MHRRYAPKPYSIKKHERRYRKSQILVPTLMSFDDCRVAGDKDMILGMPRSIQLTMRSDKGMTAECHETDISPKFHETRLGFCR